MPDLYQQINEDDPQGDREKDAIEEALPEGRRNH
jgi:hypothetical protein